MTTEQAIQDVAMIARNGIDRVIELERDKANQDGMTLRDYFAAHEQLDPNESIGLALAERLAGRPHPAPRDITGNIKSGGDPVEVAVFWADAEAAYRYLRADAMLRARSAP